MPVWLVDKQQSLLSWCRSADWTVCSSAATSSSPLSKVTSQDNQARRVQVSILAIILSVRSAVLVFSTFMFTPVVPGWELIRFYQLIMELSNDPPGPGGRTELSWRRDSWKAATSFGGAVVL